MFPSRSVRPNTFQSGNIVYRPGAPKTTPQQPTFSPRPANVNRQQFPGTSFGQHSIRPSPVRNVSSSRPSNFNSAGNANNVVKQSAQRPVFNNNSNNSNVNLVYRPPTKPVTNVNNNIDTSIPRPTNTNPISNPKVRETIVRNPSTDRVRFVAHNHSNTSMNQVHPRTPTPQRATMTKTTEPSSGPRTSSVQYPLTMRNANPQQMNSTRKINSQTRKNGISSSQSQYSFPQQNQNAPHSQLPAQGQKNISSKDLKSEDEWPEWKPRPISVPRMNTVRPTKISLPVKNDSVDQRPSYRDVFKQYQMSGTGYNSYSQNDSNNTNIQDEDEEDDDDDNMCDESECRLCNIKFDKIQAYHVHIRSTSHLQKVMGKKAAGASSSSASTFVPVNELHCNICVFTFSSKEVFDSHIQGLAHQKKLEQIREAHERKIKEEKEIEESSRELLRMKHEARISRNKQLNEALDYLERENLLDKDIITGNEILCKDCNVKCSGFISFKMHLDGMKHKKKLKQTATDISNAKVMKMPKGRVICPGKDLWIEEELNKCTEPLIGMDYMTEYQLLDPDQEPRYLCDLCMSKMDHRQVINHLTGLNHRHKYFKYHDIVKYNTLWHLTPKSLKATRAKMFAAQVESREGRHRMRIKLQVTPMESIKDKSEWLEVANNNTRPMRDLPGIKSAFNEDDVRYRNIPNDGNEEDMDDGMCSNANPLFNAYHHHSLNKAMSFRLRPNLKQLKNEHMLPIVADYGHGGKPVSRIPMRQMLPRPCDVIPDFTYSDTYRPPSPLSTSYEDTEEDYPSYQASNVNNTSVINYDHNSMASKEKKNSKINDEIIKEAILKCDMNSESDAETALHISNAITQGLLEYRLQSMSEAENENSELKEQFETLKNQNASLILDKMDANCNPIMSLALKEAQYMAKLLPIGDEDLFLSAMSILDSINNKLYGVLEENKVDEVKNETETEVEKPTENPKSDSSNVKSLLSDDGVYRFKINSKSTNHSAKRFKFGL